MRRIKERAFAVAMLVIVIWAFPVLPNVIAAEEDTGKRAPGISRGRGRLVSTSTVPMLTAPINTAAEPKGVQMMYMNPERLFELKRLDLPPHFGGGTPIEDTAPSTPPPLDQNFQGISCTGHYPPDPAIAVGPSHVVVVVNKSWAIYDKYTGNQQHIQTLADLFGPVNPPGLPVYPKVIYDHWQGRWVILALADDDESKSSYLIGVSDDSNPHGDWWVWNLDATVDGSTPSDFCADYPGLGFDNAGAVYITSNQHNWSDDFQYAKLRILYKTELYWLGSGGVLNFYDFWDYSNDDETKVFAWKPAHSFGVGLPIPSPDSPSEFLLNTKPEGGNIVTLWAVKIAVPPTLERWATLTIGNYTPPPDALHGGWPIYTGDCRTQDVMYQGEGGMWFQIYTAFCERHDWGSGEDVAAIRYLKIDAYASTVREDITYGKDYMYYFYPAAYGLRDYYGSACIVFNRSGYTGVATEFAGVRYVAQFPDNPASGLLKAGENMYDHRVGDVNLWGNYSGIARDPDPYPWGACRTYICGEYASSSRDEWGTWVGKVRPAGATPVEFASFTATGYKDYIEVEWTTATEIDNAGFNLYRGLSKEAERLQINQAMLASQGDELKGAAYSFKDNGVTGGVTYHYWLEYVDFYGNAAMHGPVSATLASGTEKPSEFMLTQNYPNPFSPVTEIRYGLPSDCQVKIEVYNALGQKVATIADGRQKAGYKLAAWDGRDTGGKEVYSGVYFYKLQAGSFTEVKKMVLLR